MLNYMTEAVARMNRRGVDQVTWTLSDRIIQFRFIPAIYARNWDGSLAGDGQDPNKVILERMDWRTGFSPCYTNWW